jgi:pimeloyl-ACP methyl ester carboxylesterase
MFADLVRFFGPIVEQQMQSTANNIAVAEDFEKCGHSLALEQPARLANLLKRFIL